MSKCMLLQCSPLVVSTGTKIKREYDLLWKLFEIQQSCILPDICEGSKLYHWLHDFQKDLSELDLTGEESIVLKSLGSLWVRWGCIQMRVFAIIEPIDPQTQLYWEATYTNNEEQLLTRESTLRSVYYAFLTGLKQNEQTHNCWSSHGLQHPLLHATEKRLIELREKLKKCSNSNLRLTDEDKYLKIKTECIRFLENYGWQYLCNESMKSIHCTDTSSIIEWSTAAYRILEYLLESQDTVCFPDLVEPFAVGISRILEGFSMIIGSVSNSKLNERSLGVERICKIFCHFPNVNAIDTVEFILSNEFLIRKDIENILNIVDDRLMGRIFVRIMLLCLRLLLQSQTVISSSQPNHRIFKCLFIILDRFELLLMNQEKKLEERKDAKESLYVSMQTINEGLTEEEINELDIYFKVCPSALRNSSDDSCFTFSKTLYNSVSKINDLRSKLDSLEKGLLLTEDMIYAIVKYTNAIVNGETIYNSNDTIYRDLYRFGAAILCSEKAQIETECNLLPMHLSALTWEVESLLSRKTKLDLDKPYNVYQDPVNVSDLLLVKDVLVDIKSKLYELLSCFPDHGTLQSLLRKVQNVLNMSVDYPLIVFINNIERLIHEIQEWEIVAAKHVSMASFVTKLNDVLSNWRHLELKMWSSSLESASWKEEYVTFQEFFKFYGDLRKYIKLATSVNECTKSLDIINTGFTSSTIGCYGSRLNLLNLVICLIRQMEDIDSRMKNELISIFSNYFNFYNVYSVPINEYLLREKKKIDKELSQFIKTKKWGSGPPKSTEMNKCHKTVFKYLRQWSEVLRKQSKTFFDVKSIKLTDVKYTKTNDTKLQNLSEYSENMLEFFTDLLKDVEALQKETRELENKATVESKNAEDKELAEKQWRITVTNLQQQKRMCLNDYVKIFAQMGINVNSSKFNFNSALFDRLPLGDYCQDTITDINVIRCISVRLKLDEIQIADDINNFNDIKDRIICACDNFLSVACSITTVLKQTELEIKNFHEAFLELQCTFECTTKVSEDPQKFNDILMKVKMDYLERLKYLKEFFELCVMEESVSSILLIDEQMKPNILIESERTKSLADIYELIVEWNKLECPKGSFINVQHYDVFQKQIHLVDVFDGMLKSISHLFLTKNELITESIITKLFDKHLENQELLNKMSGEIIEYERVNLLKGTDQNDLKNELHKYACRLKKDSELFDSLLIMNDELSFKNIESYMRTLSDAIRNSQFVDQFNQLKMVTKKFSSDAINKSLQNINVTLLTIGKNFDALLNRYYTLACNCKTILVAGLETVLWLALKILKDGFCTPSDGAWHPQEENVDEKMNNFEMAGMGDGQGTNDVSKQIESEDQLEGVRNENMSNPENFPDVPDEENGIEMTEDFEAQLHDPEVDETNENDSGNDNFDDLEDTMGETGDAPETDINKNTWDEGEEKEEKEDKVQDSRNGEELKEDTTKMVSDSKEENDDSKVKGTDFSEFNSDKNEQNTELENGDEKQDQVGFDDTDVEQRDLNNQDLEENRESSEFDPEEIEVDETMDQSFEEVKDENSTGAVKEIDEPADEEKIEEPEKGCNEEDAEINHEDDINHEETADNSVSLPGLSLNDNSTDENVTNDQTGSELSAVDNKQGTGNNGSNETPNNVNEISNPLPSKEYNSKTLDNRKLGEADKSFKRKAEIVDTSNNENKRQKSGDAFSLMANDEEVDENDGVEQVLHDATALEQQNIPNSNEEEMEEVVEEMDEDKKSLSDEEQAIDSVENMNSKTCHPNEKKIMSKKEIDCFEEDEKKSEDRQHCWSRYEANSEYLARQLCEKLRIVLEPTKANKLGGAYRTGKRLNMKKVIPYIASGFRKDKIWLRRNIPCQREYQVLLGVDNSRSMSYNVPRDLFFESLAVVLNGLSFLEVGSIGICKFGSKAEVVHPLVGQYNSSVGDHLVNTFDFSCGSSRFIPILELALKVFSDSAPALSSNRLERSQLLLLLSDGGLTEDVEDLKLTKLIREAHNRGILVVVIVLDHSEPQNSIFNLKLVANDGNDFLRFLDVFPFQNYTVLQDVSKLPTVLTDMLKQWYELASSTNK